MKQRLQKLSEILLAGKFWTTLSYRLDLTPNDFHLFCYLKRHLDRNHYNDNEAMKRAMTSWLLEQAVSFFKETIQNPVVRYDTCLNKNGSYVKKQRNHVESGNKFNFWKFSFIWFLLSKDFYIKNDPPILVTIDYMHLRTEIILKILKH